MILGMVFLVTSNYVRNLNQDKSVISIKANSIDSSDLILRISFKNDRSKPRELFGAQSGQKVLEICVIDI